MGLEPTTTGITIRPAMLRFPPMNQVVTHIVAVNKSPKSTQLR
jgi:hypothetical protein